MDKQDKKEQIKQEELKSEDEKVENKEIKEDEKQNKIVQLEEQVKRYLADYQNLQRRVQQEKYQWIKSANKDLLLKLLPVLDTLMLAAKHINDKGLELSINQFLQALEQEEVKRIKTVGEKFDPKTMEAIGTAEGKKDIVAEEARAGFMLHDNVLRSAQVLVGS